MTKKYAKDFKQSTYQQRTDGWYKERVGKPSASRLGDFMNYTKAGLAGYKRKEYMRQLAFERLFNTNFMVFESQAMRDGVFYEDFAKQLYTRETKTEVKGVNSFISDYFVATPDGLVGDGLLECKVVGDGTFAEYLVDGVKQDHALQVQGQLLATGRDWCDYVIVNLKTRAYAIHRLYRDNNMIQMIYDKLHEPLELPELDNKLAKRFDSQLVVDYLAGKNSEEVKRVEIDLPF